MGEPAVIPARGAAAFFDLDKTTIADAALFAFSSTLRDAGFIDSRLILRAVWGRLVFKYLGADHDRSVRTPASGSGGVSGGSVGRDCLRLREVSGAQHG